MLALVLPLGAGPFLLDRLLVSLASTYLAYSLMSLAYESLFLLLFMVLLVAFVRLEHPALDEAQFKQLRVRGGQSSAGLLGLDAHSFGPFEPREWQRAAVLLVLVEVAFFGTGNLAALNGFNPSTIRNFVSTFSPFLMAALLVLKVALPFFLVAVAFVLVLDRQPEKVLRLGVLLMIITDVMAMVSARAASPHTRTGLLLLPQGRGQLAGDRHDHQSLRHLPEHVRRAVPAHSAGALDRQLPRGRLEARLRDDGRVKTKCLNFVDATRVIIYVLES